MEKREIGGGGTKIVGRCSAISIMPDSLMKYVPVPWHFAHAANKSNSAKLVCKAYAYFSNSINYKSTFNGKNG